MTISGASPIMRNVSTVQSAKPFICIEWCTSNLGRSNTTPATGLFQVKSKHCASSLRSVRTDCPETEKELLSKMTLSLAVGMHSPGDPPETTDQCKGSSHKPSPPTQYKVLAGSSSNDHPAVLPSSTDEDAWIFPPSTTTSRTDTIETVWFEVILK